MIQGIPILCEAPQKVETVAKPELSDEEFVKYVEDKVLDTIERYDLFDKDTKVMVAVSGGKDSTALLHILHKFGFTIEAVTVDAKIGCYTEKNLENIRNFSNSLGVKLHEISFRKEFGGSLCYLQEVLKEKGTNLKSCSTCGILRRYIINKRSRELNPDAIATGHNMDDEAQVFLMNVAKNNLQLAARMGPKPGLVKSDKFIARVKPMYFISEDEIIRYSKIKEFPVHIGKCPCSTEGLRNFFKDLLNHYEGEVPEIKEKILRYYLDILPKLREQFSTSDEVNCCTSCGEPSAQETCRTCQILSKL